MQYMQLYLFLYAILVRFNSSATYSGNNGFGRPSDSTV